MEFHERSRREPLDLILIVKEEAAIFGLLGPHDTGIVRVEDRAHEVRGIEVQEKQRLPVSAGAFNGRARKQETPRAMLVIRLADAETRMRVGVRGPIVAQNILVPRRHPLLER